MRFALGVVVGIFVGRPVVNSVGERVAPFVIDKVLSAAERVAERYGYVIQKEDER
uniref:YtxH domain-containing protein n=1 Tax=Streptomyces phage Scarif TaxID=3158858 RepID=A0AAU7GZN7_9CAUD